MISKELLSEVLNDEGNVCTGNIQVTSRVIHYERNGSQMSQINIYELAHKCKEWAHNLGYNITSGYSDMNYDGDSDMPDYRIYSTINLRCGYHSYNSKHDVDEWHEDMIFDMNITEPEAIFKACQWILDNKE